MNAIPDPAAVTYEIRDAEGRAYAHPADEATGRRQAEGHAGSCGAARTLVRVEVVWSSEADAAATQEAAEEQERIAEEAATAEAAEQQARANAKAKAADDAAAKKAKVPASK